MNRYEFEDKISDYLDNNLNVSDRQAFEQHVKENKDAEDLLSSVKSTIKLLKKQKSVKSSEDFMINLNARISTYKKIPQKSTKQRSGNSIFGFTSANSVLIGVFVLSFLFLLSNIAPEANSFFQSNIVSNDRNIIKKITPNSPTDTNSKNEFVSADSTEQIMDTKEKINIKDKIKLVKNKR